MSPLAWGLVAFAFFTVILVIYWLTEKPPRVGESRQYPRPMYNGKISNVTYTPPEVIAVLEDDGTALGVARAAELPYTPPADEHWEKLTQSEPEQVQHSHSDHSHHND